MERIGVLTSGGDAPGMNAAVRAVVRTAIAHGAEVFAIFEGYQGMIEGGERIQRFRWNNVGGILEKGGTIIGSARCLEFKEIEGRKQAAKNLLDHGIDKLVICGGDGSLTGANLFRKDWSNLLQMLVDDGEITPEKAERHQNLTIAGLAGSIDNDLCGTDVTIGADTALHRIIEAVDAISSTAASHQRCFVVEVMGRRCGYLALMSALASGADWCLIPECPPDSDNWEQEMCDVLYSGRATGRRDSIVIIAEGAQDRYGRPIESNYIKRTLEERLGEDTRVTILGHVQRGGTPSVFDRNFSTLTGVDAVEALLDPINSGEAFLVGLKANRIHRIPLEESLSQTKEVYEAIKARDYGRAMELRGGSFGQAWDILQTLIKAKPNTPNPDQRSHRFAVINTGAPAPGMNTAVRAAVRIAIDKGHEVLAIKNGFKGFVTNVIQPMDWMSVNGWVALGGSVLGCNRYTPEGDEWETIANHITEHKIEALLMIGGWSGYLNAMEMKRQSEKYPALNIPVIAIPATIDNDIPGCELSIGTDTALNCIMDAVDKITHSAVAANRVFVVEVMGRYSGYLALMSALATGAERVYLPEEGVTLSDLQKDVEMLSKGFHQGKRVGLMVRNECVSKTYDTSFMVKVFEEEGGDLYDVRQAILGHLQQGGDPNAFDRVQGSRQAWRAVEYIEAQLATDNPISASVGLIQSQSRFTSLEEIAELRDWENGRQKDQWWLRLRPIARMLAQPAPDLDK